MVNFPIKIVLRFTCYFCQCAKYANYLVNYAQYEHVYCRNGFYRKKIHKYQLRIVWKSLLSLFNSWFPCYFCQWAKYANYLINYAQYKQLNCINGFYKEKYIGINWEKFVKHSYICFIVFSLLFPPMCKICKLSY